MPQSGPIPQQQMYPQSGGFPTTGGFPQTGAYPQSGPQPVGQYPPPPGAPGGKRGKAALIIVAAVVVVAALATVGFFVFKPAGPNFPSAQDCQKVGGERDAKGFTPCMKQLAGAVADGDCTVQESTDKGARAKCTLADGYTVTYLQYDDQADLDGDMTRAWVGAEGDIVQAQWKGNGLAGSYKAGDSGGSLLVFSVEGRPLVGVLEKETKVNPDLLANYFEQKIQPGS